MTKDDLIAAVESLKGPEKTITGGSINAGISAALLVIEQKLEGMVIIEEKTIQLIIERMDGKFSDLVYVGKNYTIADVVRELKAIITA